MADMGSITRLFNQLQSPATSLRNEAATLLMQRYGAELQQLITEHLQKGLRQRVGPDDVMQDVFASFFRRQGQGDYDLANREDFLKLLLTIALNKVCSAARLHRRKRRDFRREQPLDQTVRGSDEPTKSDYEDEQVAQPDAVAEVSEEVEKLLSGLNPELREVAVMRLEGYTATEIATRIDRSVRTVERRMERIRDRWTKESSSSETGEN